MPSVGRNCRDMKKITVFMAAVAVLAACAKVNPDPVPDPVPPSPPVPDPELVYPAPEPDEDSFVRAAYFPYYGSFDAGSFPDSMFRYIDVAFYAFAQLQDDYTVKLGSASVASTVVDRCHRNNVKVVLSFAGSWLDKRFTTLSCSAELRNRFVNSLMEIVNEYGFDGVDNDWEYPSSKDGSQRGNLLLMRQLSNELHAPGVGKTLSMAITPGIYEGAYTAGLDHGVFDCCDWFGSMVYDDDQPHSPYSMMEKSFQFWVEKNKMPLKKFIGGIPCYGRGSRSEGKWDKSKSYRNLVLNYGADPDADEVVTDGYVTNYNGRKTVEKKVQFLLSKNAGGYFFWEADQDMKDERSLLRTASATVDSSKPE